MRLRLKHNGVVRFAGLALAVTGLASAGSATQPLPPRIKSIVRADARGRLVRTVVVAAQRSAAEAAETVAPSIDSAAVADLVETTAKRYNVDPLLVHSVIQVESNYSPFAVSHKGAQGLMQLMPATARRFGVRNTFDPKENIEGGVRYLKYLESLFPNEPHLTLAAYNAGEGAVWKYGNTIPPYRETEQYVRRVGARYAKARKAADLQKKPEPAQTADAADTSEPLQEAYAPVQAFVDAEGRLHLRNADSTRAEQTP